ncbi:hypothetical protein [Pseudomonas sp. Au-Pse12]|uniref:hypothetical protein n=1 Tax=Pseudomonas sp. Au-Pse12 TaxID=2906459 RepID=UPI001E5601E1|nr:hypothetical protein [Pseudomonas sp. Au-Pse12]MCE4053293.1 hypothetical protein [Pseudomonas sp. Au-Pse12]
MKWFEPCGLGLALCAWLGVVTAAQARCDNTTDTPGEFYVCKPWPAEPELSISARATPMPGSQAGDVSSYSLDVSLQDIDSGWTLASNYKDSALFSDAVALQGLQIDTGRYRLNQEQRAFGLRVLYHHSSSAMPYEKSVLTLYRREDKEVLPLLEGLVMDESNGEFGWGGECVGRSRTLHRTLEVGSGQRNAYADLIVRTREVSTEHFKGRDGCESRDLPPRNTQVTLHYDGRQYPLPKALKGV